MATPSDTGSCEHKQDTTGEQTRCSSMLSLGEKDDSARPSKSPSPGISLHDDEIEWRYLTWETLLPRVAFDTTTIRNDQNDLMPSTRSYEKYINPFDWSSGRKTAITWMSSAATAMTAYTAGSYTSGDAQMMEKWGVSKVVVTLGVTMFTIGFGLAPMVLAPFSEIIGRRPVFVITGALLVITQLCCALTESFAGMLVARFWTGCFGSTFSTMVGGVVADLYQSKDRNTAMALFSGAAMFGTGLGPLISSLIAAHTTWRWIFYLQVVVGGVMWLLIVVFFKETRGSVLLSRKAKALNKYYEALEGFGVLGVWDTDVHGQPLVRRVRWKVKSDEERASIWTMISISCYRPFHLLVTESVIFFFSLWVSFSWIVLYLTFGVLPLVFQTLYHFNLEQTGATFTSVAVAGIISTIIAITGDKLMKRIRPDVGNTPEARLWFPCIQSCLLPIGLFWFAWTSYASVPWIVPCIGICVATMGIYSIYLAVFNYIADTYGAYASSGLAAQSFCRNMLGGAMPLLVDAMYDRLGFHGGSSLMGGLGLLLTVVPFVLVIYGPRIRARSKFACDVHT